MNAVVRKGEIKDLPDVLRLIKELALYEKEPDEVEITLDELQRDFTSPHHPFDFLIAILDDKAVGMAFYYERYSTWKGRYLYLEDLIVSQKFRGQGIGKQLFESLAQLCIEKGMKKMQWQVLDWNVDAIDFYKKYNSKFDEGWIDVKLDGTDLKKLGK